MSKPAQRIQPASPIVFFALLVSGCHPASPGQPLAPGGQSRELAGSDSEVARTEETASQPDGPLPMPPVPPPAKVDRVRVPGEGCYQDAQASEVRNAESDTAKLNEAAYQAELRRQGLTTLSLGTRDIELHRGVRGEPTRTVVIPQNMIPGPQAWSGRAASPKRWEFVQAPDGSVYRVRRILQPARAREIVLCGCKKKQCGPYGMGCPACGMTTQRLYGPLAAGATFKGELTVRFTGETVRVSHDQGACMPQRACPAPPPSMRPGPR